MRSATADVLVEFAERSRLRRRSDDPATDVLVEMLADARPRAFRSLRRFAESEVVIPDGRFENRRFRANRQPFARLWLDEVDSRRWRRFNVTGCVQSGKTFLAFVLPILYFLFERAETVVLGAPNGEICDDKWSEDLLPAIKASPTFRKHLPTRGRGSLGGRSSQVRFENGAVLRYMTGGGGDKKRSAFTTRVVVITETDGLDEVGGKSRETDKVSQIEARTAAYGSRGTTFLECTVSTEQGRTWQEHIRGTESRIAVRCVHCSAWTTPEREHLVGWKGAANVVEAGENSLWICPECGKAWTEQERVDMNRDAVLVHRGQEVEDDGTVSGDPPETDTFSFRWNAFNNLFVDASYVGRKEWNAARADTEEAERELRQYWWVLPSEPTETELAEVRIEAITARTVRPGRGIVPTGAQTITVGVDVGKWLLHWVAVAWTPDGSGRVIDYDVQDVPSNRMATDAAIRDALEQLDADVFSNGWRTGDGEVVRPVEVWIDSAYQGGRASIGQRGEYPVYSFIVERGEGYRATHGQGAGQAASIYKPPRQRSRSISYIGDGFHLSRLREPVRIELAVVNADRWKTFLHERLSTPVGAPGALTLFDAPGSDHIGIARHLTAEKRVEEYKPSEQRTVTVWRRIRRQNHYLDAGALACVAGWYAGVRIEGPGTDAGSRRPRGQRQAVGSWWSNQRGRSRR